jgi:zinc protease
VSLFLFAAAGFVPALGQSPSPKKIASVEGITEYRLDNGLRVLLFPDRSRPKVTVNLTVFVGSRHEGYGETGMAHLLEHMVFKGTPTHPDIPGLMKERGAVFNGSTWVDRTNYYETLPASDDNLEFALKLEADRMVNSPIKAEDLATEFSVVRNEFEAGENDPQGVLMQRMMAVAYEWHNYGKSTIGNRSDIERVPVDNLRAFYRKFYQPDNAMLVVAGQFDEAKALQFISKYFGALPRPDRVLQETYTEEPPQDGERTVHLRRVGDVGLVGLLYHVPAASHPEFPAAQVLARILTSEPSGRLYKALVETKKAASVQAFPFAFREPGALLLGAEVNTKDLEVLQGVRADMLAALDEIARKGVTKEEVDRARQQLLKERELAAADPNRIAIQLSEWAAQGDWRLYFLNRDRLEQVTPEQVQQVASRYFPASNRTTGYFIPTDKPERTPIPATPDIARLVEGYKGRDTSSGGEAFDVAPIAIERRTQRPEPIAGVKLALLPKKTRGEAVRLNLVLHYGNADNLKGLTEAADLLGTLLMRGTRSLTRQQIQDALDENFARMSVQGVPGGLTVTIETKRTHLPAVLDILRQVLREPTLPADEFEVLKNERLARLEQGRNDPQRLASIRLQRLLSQYPPDDVRYVPTIEEEIDRLKATSIDQVRTVYHDYLGADHGELAVVGDFEPSEVLPLLARAFDGWKAAKPYARIDRAYQAIEPTRDQINTPDKANAIYLAGLTLPLRDSDPDYPALLMGNYVLGGGALSSRIADRLRQKGGLSYGAGSGFNADPFDPYARLSVFAIYNPINVAKVIEGVDDELAKLVQNGVTDEELEKAKKGYLQQRQVQRTNDGSLAGQLASHLYVGRTMRFEADEEAKIAALTVEEVNAAIRKRLDPKKLTVVTAGDFAKRPKADTNQ